MTGWKTTLLVTAGTLFALSGCTAAGISGAGQMRVDVEVYKGPLSKEPEVQLGELSGVINETSVAVDRFRSFIDRYAGELGCWDVLAAGNTYVSNEISGRVTKKTLPVCLTLGDLRADVDDLRALTCSPEYYQSFVYSTVEGRDLSASEMQAGMTKKEDSKAEFACLRRDAKLVHDELVKALNPLSNSASSSSTTFKVADVPDAQAEAKFSALYKKIAQGLTLVLSETAEVATQLKVKAANWAGIHLTSASADDETRRLATSFQILAAEYSNQLSSRADTLLKQLALYGNDRQALPLSVHLRDASPTEFVSLALWNYAIDGPVGGESGLGSYKENRLQVFKSLYEDANWSRINTVTAVGRGDVSMAFVKDEIGNWSLKQFSNDPTQLLDAYKDLGIAAIGKATSIISGIATGGGSAAAGEALSAGQALSKAASDFALGGNSAPPPTIAGANLDQLRTEMVGELRQIRDTLAAREQALTTEVPAARTAMETAATDLTTAQSTLQQDQTSLALGGGSSAAVQSKADTQAALAAALTTEIDGLDPTVAANVPVIRNLTQQRDAATAASREAAAQVSGLKALEEKIATTQAQVSQLSIASEEAKAKYAKLKNEQTALMPTAVAQTQLVLRQYEKLVNALQSMVLAPSGGAPTAASPTPPVPTPTLPVPAT